MIKPITTVLLLSSLASLSSAEQLKSVSTNQASTVRLIVSGELSTSSAHAMSHASSVRTDNAGYSVVEVSENDADAMISLLKQQPGVRSVEKDLIVTNPPMPAVSAAKVQQLANEVYMSESFGLSGDQPNDPEYINQYSWKERSELLNGQHSILKGYKKSNPTKKMRIGMTDSGFYDREDINYAGGYNLATFGDSDISPIFFENEWNPSCTTPHGGSVAHIIGADTDNGVGVAGIVDADLFGVRVMDCGTGFLSDMAIGIRWLSRDTSLSGSITPIDKPVDIINVSMGAEVKDEACPTYVQEAIDYAYGKGIAIFVAAGNNGFDAKNYTPANCNNVITVGSIDRYGNQSDFSNYGAAIDVAALGEMVLSEGTNDYSYWFGTSFSTPNTVGMAALAKQANPSMSVNALYNYVKTTTHSFNSGSTTNALGTGVVNADQLMTSVNQDIAQNIPLLNPAMDTSERCQKAALSNIPFMDENGIPVDACAVFEMDASLLESEVGFPNRSLYRVPQGQAYNLSNAQLVKASESEKFIVYNLDPKSYDYGFANCDSGNSTCSSEELIPVNDDFIDESRYCVNP